MYINLNKLKLVYFYSAISTKQGTYLHRAMCIYIYILPYVGIYQGCIYIIYTSLCSVVGIKGQGTFYTVRDYAYKYDAIFQASQLSRDVAL